jgi:hypothetical protein
VQSCNDNINLSFIALSSLPPQPPACCPKPVLQPILEDDRDDKDDTVIDKGKGRAQEDTRDPGKDKEEDVEEDKEDEEQTLRKYSIVSRSMEKPLMLCSDL